ncbi:M10 family metallopeptidase [Microvirga pudoricolor]|uniref:M10 family metallopeptidase n=1 Tax=Microvirga pudoricolor TaxID=2778729 RepID=UPI001951290D|nr:M10 family metallopeptidase [Microvirga pudoricolor]MBM6594608.1 M10 family metallopeptidase C-terminal domain-containing protein [Microvirga pudoricolor]
MTLTKNVAGTGYGSVYLDSVIWGGKVWDMNTGPLKAWLGEASDIDAAIEVHGPSMQGQDPETGVKYDFVSDDGTMGNWNPSIYQRDINAIIYAMDQYTKVSGIRFAGEGEDAQTVGEADIVWWKTPLPAGILGIHDGPTNTQAWGYFNRFAESWGDFTPGSLGLYTIIHEIGHGLGLAHPHDGGEENDASRFPGVNGASDVGQFGLNQSPYTVMSYNYNLAAFPTDGTYGLQTGLGAFDIAAMQKLYGPNNETAKGDDVYVLPHLNASGTGWTCIWDTGGIDTISASKSKSPVTIDLRAATLASNDAYAGGIISQEKRVAGGFTIANGVAIENAIGNVADDILTGNHLANRLTGGDGNDILDGLGGNDVLDGGNGNDTYYVDSAGDLIIDSGGVDTVYSTQALKFSADIENVFVNGVRVGGVGTVVSPVLIPSTSGRDVMVGGAGVDRLAGGLGSDKLTGGLGADTFVFNTRLGKKNIDTITDFDVREDTIELAKSIFKKIPKKALLKDGTLKKDYFHTKKTAADTKDMILYDKKKSGALYYDPDGKGDLPAVQFAKLAKNLKLTASDFKVV